MHKFLLIGLFFSMAVNAHQNTNHLQEKPFVFIIKPNNCTNDSWKKNTLTSIFQQNYTNFRVIYIYRYYATRTLVEEYINEKQLQHRLTFVANASPLSILANMCQADESIIVRDEDEWIKDAHYLKQLNKKIQDSGTTSMIVCENSSDLS